MAVSINPSSDLTSTAWGPETLGALGVATRLDIGGDSNAEVLLITAVTGALRVSHTGTDGAPLAAPYTVIPSGQALRVKLRPSDRARTQGYRANTTLYIAGDAAGAVVASGILEMAADGNAS
jgi:hypothetical protein